MNTLSVLRRNGIPALAAGLVSVFCLAVPETEEQINDTETFGGPKVGTVLKPPTVLQVKRAVGKLGKREPNAVTLYTRSFNVDTPEGIRELFARCRDVDKQVAGVGKSVLSKQVEKLTSDSTYTKTYGVKTLEGKHFRIVGPKKIIRYEKGRKVAKSADDFLKKLLDAADTTFEKTTSNLLMNQFMNWAKTKGTIYVIPSDKVWARIRPPTMKTEIVQTVVPNDSTRELCIYVSPKDQDFAGQALGYSVAAMVNREYSRIITGKPDATMPVFFITGLSANEGNLEVVITEMGPVKLKEFVVLRKKVKMGRPKPGTNPPPLKEKQLIPLDSLTIAKGYPARLEDMYYFLLQSSVLVKDLQEKAPLSFIALTRKLAEGKKFAKEIGLSYMEMQRSIEGRELVKPKKKANGTKAETIEEMDYKRFSRYADKIFYELTETYLNEQLKEKLKKKKAEAKKAAAAKEGSETAQKPKSEKTAQAKTTPAGKGK
jgi:hypothetical protein